MNSVIAFPAATAATPVEWSLERLARAKRSFATRRLRLDDVALLSTSCTPRAGDVVVARVARVGQHSGLQLPDGRRSTLFVGDEVIVAYGNRYAPDQFEALVPPDLSPCALAAGGGIAARVVRSHSRMKAPTELHPIGLLCDEDRRPINLARFALPPVSMPARLPPVIVVAGTSMNAGKTTAASQLVHGLSRAGLRVAAAKLTGTGASGDTMLMRDAGAQDILDFTDMGLATTYLAPIEELERIADGIVARLADGAAQAIVVEIADGLYQAETAALLRSPRFRRLISGVVFASPDAMGAAAGVEWLGRQRLPVLALAGAMTASPLAVREAVAATRLPVMTSGDLADPAQARRLLSRAELAGEGCQIATQLA